MKDVYTYATLFRPKDFENRPINTKVTAILKFDIRYVFLRGFKYFLPWSSKHLKNTLDERRPISQLFRPKVFENHGDTMNEWEKDAANGRKCDLSIY